jgi:hypothetical protein
VGTRKLLFKENFPSPSGRGVRGEGQIGLQNYLFSLTLALSQRERESFKSLNLMAVTLQRGNEEVCN